jgi:hypothetical protein
VESMLTFILINPGYVQAVCNLSSPKFKANPNGSLDKKNLR